MGSCDLPSGSLVSAMAQSARQTSPCRILCPILVLIILLSCSASSDPILPAEAELLPRDPIIKPGETLNLTCSIEDKTLNLTAANISFKVNTKQNVTKILTVVDDYSLNLIVPNVTKSVFVICYLGGTIGAMESIRVHYPPEVKNMRCQLHNWEDLTCAWSPPSQETLTVSKVTLSVLWRNMTIGNNSPEWIEREIQDIGMVSWDMKNYTHEELQNITLRMKIRVVNALTEYESDEYSFFLPDISSPNPVRNLAASPGRRKTSVKLTWTPGDLSNAPDLWYRVTYISQWDHDQLPMVVYCMEPKIYLEDLETFTDYTISVQSQYNGTKLWSPPVNTTYRTPKSRPDRAPEITPGSYEVKHCGTRSVNCQQIFVYWKPLPIQVMRDDPDNVDYSLKLEANSSCLLIKQIAYPVYSAIYKHPLSNMNFTAQRDCDITVTIAAWNRAGGQQDGPPSRIHIARESKWPEIPKLIVNAAKENEGSDKDILTLEWERSAENSANNYTVFWCLWGFHKCKNVINWAVIPSPINNYSVLLPATLTYRYVFGLSVQKEDVSSGITWSDCTYDNSKVSPSPTISLSLHQPHEGLRFEVNPASCADLGGHVYSYLVHSCRVNACPLKNNATCIDLIQKDVISGDLKTFSLRGLPPGETFVVWLRSLSRAGKSRNPSNMICHVITQSWLTKSAMAGIVFAVIILSVFLIAGIVAFIKYCRKIQHWYNKGVEITRPDKTCPTLRLSEGPLCEEPKLEEMWTFDKQLSVESNISADSGRGSMNRTNGLRVSIPDEEMDEVFLDEPLMDAGYVEVDDPYDMPAYLTAKTTPSDNYRHQNGHCGGPPKLVSSGSEPQSKGPGHPVRNGFVRTSHSPHRAMPAVPLPKVEEEGSSCEGERLDPSDPFTLPPMVTNPTYCEVLPDDGGINAHIVSS